LNGPAIFIFQKHIPPRMRRVAQLHPSEAPVIEPSSPDLRYRLAVALPTPS